MPSIGCENIRFVPINVVLVSGPSVLVGREFIVKKSPSNEEGINEFIEISNDITLVNCPGELNISRYV